MPAFVYEEGKPFGARGATNIQYVTIASDGTIGDLQVINKAIRIKLAGRTVQLRSVPHGAFRVKTSAGSTCSLVNSVSGAVSLQTSAGVKRIM